MKGLGRESMAQCTFNASAFLLPPACRLTLFECEHGHALAAVSMLGALPASCRLRLAIDSCEREDEHVWVHNWPHWVYLPPLAGLPIKVVELRLVGAVSLPPDWHQLQHLQRLVVHNERHWAVEEQ